MMTLVMVAKETKHYQEETLIYDCNKNNVSHDPTGKRKYY